jgi:hypothetical protein
MRSESTEMKTTTAALTNPGTGLNQLEVFLFLQLLDFMTTLIGMRMGGSELSPFVRWMMSFDVVFGLAMVKMIGFALGGYCVLTKRLRVIGWVNIFFAGLVVWNLHNILGALTPTR